MIDSKIKLVTILGPTASGKTDLALDLAELFGGEIICADSRTIYRGMDIGTAKPTLAEQKRVPHHLLDIVDPGETLSAAAFKTLAEAAISDIAGRSKVPFLVGGSGLYLDAVLYDYQFPAQPGDRRAELAERSDDELLELLAAEDPEAFETVDRNNRRRVVRALETVGQARGKLAAVPDHVLVLGLQLNKEVMQNRIRQRVEKMLEKGFLDEVRQIGTTYGWESEAFTGIGYRAFRDTILGTKTVAEATEDFVRGDMLLVKKQQTWFKRNDAVHWLNDTSEAQPLVRSFLAGA